MNSSPASGRSGEEAVEPREYDTASAVSEVAGWEAAINPMGTWGIPFKRYDYRMVGIRGASVRKAAGQSM